MEDLSHHALTEGPFIERRRRIERSAFDTVTGRYIARSFNVSVRRPDPPLGVKYASGILEWEAPNRESRFTHYRIRIDDESSAPIQVPAAQLSYPTAVGTTFFVSTYNELADLESRTIKG